MPQVLRRRPVRIGVRAALATFVLVGFAATAGLVESVWWWTAQSNARMPTGALNRQATPQVREDVASLIAGAEATYGAIATTLSRGVIDVGEEDRLRWRARTGGSETVCLGGKPPGQQTGASRIGCGDQPGAPPDPRDRYAAKPEKRAALKPPTVTADGRRSCAIPVIP